MTPASVDSTGRIVSQLPSTLPEAGESVRLSIDEKSAGSGRLHPEHRTSRSLRRHVGRQQRPGAGPLLNPTFDPSIFTHPLTQNQVDDLTTRISARRSSDRAIGGQYAVGSIFKPITALAHWTPD